MPMLKDHDADTSREVLDVGGSMGDVAANAAGNGVMRLGGAMRVIAPLLGAALGLVFLLIGLSVRPTVPGGWVTTEGVVVDLAESQGDGGTVYAPIVEYIDANGDVRRFTAPVYLAGGLVERPGDRVEIAYDPVNPASVRLLSGSADWSWLIFAGFGGMFTIIFLGVAVWEWRGGDAVPRATEAAATAMQVATRDGRSVYRFGRPRSRLLVDVVIGPAMAIGFGLAAAMLFAVGGEALLFGLFFGAGALLLAVNTVHSLRHGLLRPAAEVGADGIWLRGAGYFRWNELADVRLESFAGPAGEQGLKIYERLALVPRHASRAGSGLGIGIANTFYRRAMPLAGRHPIDMAPIGLIGYEVSDFSGLVERVRTYHPVTSVSDDPVSAAN